MRDEDEIIYGVAAIAKAMGVPQRAAQHQVTMKRLPVFRMGRSVCIRRAALRDWIKRQEAKAASCEGKAE